MTQPSGSQGNEGIVVVGNGMAGSRFVTEMRERDPRVPLTVFGAEPQQPYNRVLLSNVLAGAARPDQIGLVDPAWYAAHDVDARLGVEVTRIDRRARLVYSGDGGVTPYGTLVIATGSTAFVPPIPGTGDGLPAGALVFRTLDDCRRILEAAGTTGRAVVVGGGLLGIEAARGLAGRGLAVTVVHLAGHLMERQLDPGAGRVLARTLARLGVHTRLEAQVSALRTEPVPQGDDVGGARTPSQGQAARSGADGGPGARVTGVELATGEFLPGDLVILACGVRPDVALAREAGLAVDRGIVVDEMLRSVTDPSVRAIGECSQYGGTVYGLVAPAWEQAAVLADLLAGTDEAARFTGARQITRLKAASVELAAMGETQHGDEDPEVEVVQFADPARGTYKKVVIKDDRLIGAILLGETGTAGMLTQLYDRAAPLPSDRLSLLFPGVNGAAVSDSPVRMPDAATVCHCNNVSKGQIRACWEQGARTAEEVAARTRASTGCGSCRDAVEGIVCWLDEQEAAPAG
ncbi:assimilatory nitrate reductase (NADH) beta subunit [Thermomonospora echinospora]|uniref:Assimilatory nitrate reductase (NADH) beta subunit n=1 Tax=Thermomonospora echinospora TaxID=1992 RepID=A0A1H6D882_9ACTN|nr:FAD-dependent oxidoreductase [Thermomonospora echinospora]SEG81521.1 assimilatory nitrate reductase (NADH) beta subunit [Thermomonospora echinospora]